MNEILVLLIDFTFYIKMTISLFVVLVILVFFLLRNEMQKNWRESIKYFKSHRYEECNSLIDEILKIYPKFIGGWILKGNVALKLDDNNNAYKFYKEALRINPNSSKALCGLGVVMRERNRYDLAEDYYYKSLKFDPENHYAKSSLMILELVKKNYEVAIALGEDSIKNGYQSVEPSILGNLLICYHYSGQQTKRDNLFEFLRNAEYSDLAYLLNAMDSDLSIDEILNIHQEIIERLRYN